MFVRKLRRAKIRARRKIVREESVGARQDQVIHRLEEEVVLLDNADATVVVQAKVVRRHDVGPARLDAALVDVEPGNGAFFVAAACCTR